MAVEVKDEARFPDKWAYFGFNGDAQSSSAAPKQVCWQCHEDHAAVDHVRAVSSHAQAHRPEIWDL